MRGLFSGRKAASCCWGPRDPPLWTASWPVLIASGMHGERVPRAVPPDAWHGVRQEGHLVGVPSGATEVHFLSF